MSEPSHYVFLQAGVHRQGSKLTQTFEFSLSFSFFLFFYFDTRDNKYINKYTSIQYTSL